MQGHRPFQGRGRRNQPTFASGPGRTPQIIRILVHRRVPNCLESIPRGPSGIIPDKNSRNPGVSICGKLILQRDKFTFYLSIHTRQNSDRSCFDFDMGSIPSGTECWSTSSIRPARVDSCGSLHFRDSSTWAMPLRHATMAVQVQKHNMGLSLPHYKRRMWRGFHGNSHHRRTQAGGFDERWDSCAHNVHLPRCSPPSPDSQLSVSVSHPHS